MKSRFFALAVLLTAVSSPIAIAGCASDEASAGDTTDDELRSGKARFHTFKGEDGQYYFNLKGGNGEILLSSEGYTSTAGRQNGIDSVKANGSKRENYETRLAMNGQYYFVLKAANNKVIADGETYVSKSNVEAARNRIARLVTNIKITEAPRVARYELFQSQQDWKYYFHLRAGNGQIVLQSEAYNSKQAAKNGIAAVKTAPVAVIEESADERFYFVVKAANGEIVGVSQTYSTKSSAYAAAQKIVTLATGTLEPTVDAATVD